MMLKSRGQVVPQPARWAKPAKLRVTVVQVPVAVMSMPWKLPPQAPVLASWNQ
jgi:hypothetical protein